MVTLKEILELTWTVTELDLWVRDPNGYLIKEYIIGEGCNEESATVHQKHRINKGELEMIDLKINYFGDKGRNGDSWGSKFNEIPKELLNLNVTHFRQSPRYGSWNGSELTATLESEGEQLGMEIVIAGRNEK